MASAFYYAAYFNKSTVNPTQSQTMTTPNNSTPRLTLIRKSAETAPTLYNGFAWAAHHHFVPMDIVYEQEDSVFFRLPAELRNQVYKELLCPTSLSLKQLAEHSGSKYPQEALYPAVLSTCRKIYEEAADLLYKPHVFQAHPSLLTSLPHLACAAKPVICPSVLSKMQRWNLTVRLDIDPRFTAAQVTAAFSGAEYFKIHVWQSMYDGCDSSVLKLFTGIRGVKVAKVTGIASEQATWLEKSMMQPVEKDERALCCRCEEKRSEISCESCHGKVGIAKEWFAGRDAWIFEE